MKRIFIILMIFVTCLIFSACRSVTAGYADELTSRNWQTETLSGIRGDLEFSENTARFTITSSEDEVSLSGVYSIDSHNLYITDVDLSQTYVFSYEVFNNRADITYMSDTLTFYPVTSDATISSES